MHLMNLQSDFLTQFSEFPENELGWIRHSFSFNANKIVRG
jgi:hypothetical protein